ncbi:Uncharacterised protein [BD1-7 clade bacterium]|uniref:Endonuclease/exonuclease/phosphatase domain-containing protein n=1 Tax=BD1-7 clade bacterium TaxID=2029982 RepID=A0A5S9N2Z0_9GAMM|nr:Uncharacterised protein [BD1-7 clade bacterium]
MIILRLSLLVLLLFSPTLFATQLFENHLRVASYNTFNGPNDVEDYADFLIIFRHIRAQEQHGAADVLDILTLSESDSGSLNRINELLDTEYPKSYASIVSSADGGGDRTAIIYNASRLTLLEETILSTALTHHIVRGRFHIDGFETQDFYVYSIHLKSGSSSSDRTERLLELQLLLADAATLPHSRILFAGDFNFISNTEPGWAELTNDNAFHDTADAVGDWRDNPLFKDVHSQNPRTNMDDRLDFHLASSAFVDADGLELITGTFRVIGNNGTHLLGEGIETGNGAPIELLQALVQFSDHLPIVSDFNVVSSKEKPPQGATFSLFFQGNAELLMISVLFVLLLARRMFN